jgi:DNA-binding response OmpR family regulator
MSQFVNFSIAETLKNKHSPFPAERFAQARILVVDDIPANVKLISGLLLAAGYRNIITAEDGLDALKQTYRSKPDLVLLDIMMPKLDGFGYCKHIRSDPVATRMPIIVQTALGEHEAKIKALSLGADDFLNKPFDTQELMLRVQLHLERFFMFRDMDELRLQLKKELEESQNIIKELGGSPGSAHSLLNKHYEVLKHLSAEPRSETN